MKSEQGKILLCMCHMSGREIDFIQEAFKDEWVVPLGPNVNGFEKELGEFLGSGSHVVALASGTSALHLGLLQCGVGKDDEVIVQTMTFSASANPVAYLGARPVFVDSEDCTWNMDPQLLDKAIADRIQKTGRKPKAILPVYLYGMPARIDEIMEVAAKWDIPVVEDAAEAMGSRYKGRFCGTFGNFGVLSFNGNKMITTSGGGALICRDKESADRTKFYATQAREAYPFYQHEEIGYNYRMSNICAGIGRGQMTILDEHLAHHRALQQIYAEEFKDYPFVTLHQNPSSDYDSNFWLCTILISEDAYAEGEENAYPENMDKSVARPDNRVEALRQRLDKAGVESRPLWKPMHMQPVFADSPAYLNGVSEKLFRSGLCIPAGPWVSEEDARFVARVIKDTLRKVD